MEQEGLVRVDGAALSRCLFLIWQAWAKRTGGDESGALDCLDSAILSAPPGVADSILRLIELGTLPVPSPDSSSEWMSRCKEALAGQLTLDIAAPAGTPAPPEPSRSLRDDLALMGWV